MASIDGTVAEKGLAKGTNWWGAFVIGLAGTILVTGIAPYVVQGTGALGILLMGVMTIAGCFLCFCLAELATMWPDRTGGIPSYATESFRPLVGNTAGILTLVGDPATFIVGSSIGLSFNGYLRHASLGGLLSLLAIVPNIFVVYHEVPAKSLREFVALAKAKPGQINYGSAGNGSAGHLAMEYLKQVTGMELQHVPYKGTGPNVTDLIAGRTQATSAGTPPLMPHVKSGKLRVIAVGTSKRLHSLPDVPTVAEQGYPGFETSQWYGLNAPAGTPEAIVSRLAAR